jgi:hypothetical protein
MRIRNTSLPSHLPTFAAIDFETADYGRDSACAVAVIRVEGLAIVDRTYYYIRPPRSHLVFSYWHGISWSDVEGWRVSGQLWASTGTCMATGGLAAQNQTRALMVIMAQCYDADALSHTNSRLPLRRVAGIPPTHEPITQDLASRQV